MCESEDTLSIGNINPVVDISVICGCGKELRIDLDGWILTVKGVMIFKCPCGKEISTSVENKEDG